MHNWWHLVPQLQIKSRFNYAMCRFVRRVWPCEAKKFDLLLIVLLLHLSLAFLSFFHQFLTLFGLKTVKISYALIVKYLFQNIQDLNASREVQTKWNLLELSKAYTTKCTIWTNYEFLKSLANLTRPNWKNKSKKIMYLNSAPLAHAELTAQKVAKLLSI